MLRSRWLLLASLCSSSVVPAAARAQSMPGYLIQPYANVPNPVRISVGSNGDIYVGRDPSSSGSNTAYRIHRVTNGGATVTEFGNATIPDPDAVFYDETGLYSGVAGAVLVGSLISGTTGRISRIEPNGTVTTLHQFSGLENPSDFVVDRAGRLLISEAKASGSRFGEVWYKTGAGAPVRLIQLAVANGAMPFVAADLSNRLYTSSADGRIRLYASDGTLLDNEVVSFAGYNLIGFPASGTDFEPTLHLLRQSTGEVFLVDTNGQATLVGTGFSVAMALHFGPDGALYVSEHGRDRIVRITRLHADLSLAVSDDPSPVTAVGGQTTWSFTVSNAGPDAAEVTELRFDAPDPMVGTVDSVVSGAGSCTLEGTQYRCDLGDLASSDEVLVTVTLTSVSNGYLTTTATVTSRSLDETPADATGSLSTRVHGACGSLSYEGECNGFTLRYCAAEATPGETVVTVNCDTEAFPSGLSGTCIFVAPGYGYDCAIPTDGECVFDDGSGEPHVAFCAGSGAGCVLNETDGSSSCESGLAPCSPAGPGESFTAYCEGDLWVRSCTVNQPYMTNCAILGGTCASTGCVDLPEGAACGENAACGAGSFCDEVTRRCVDSASVCGPRTFVERCEGQTFVYCDSVRGRVTEWDCAADGYTCGAQFTCVEGPTTGRCAEVGPSCVGKGSGETCAPERGVYCGPGRSCILERSALGPVEGRCRMAATCGPGDTHAGCVGDIATFCLSDGVITAAEAGGFDCASIGGRCLILASGEPGCASGPGGPCNPPGIIPNGALVCETGGTCRDNGDGTGTCEGGEVPDAGVMGPDAGSPPGDAGVTPDLGTVQKDGGVAEPPEDEGCGCTAAPSEPGPGANAVLLYLLAGAVLLRARRRV